MSLSDDLFTILAGPIGGRLKAAVEQAQVELLVEVLANPTLGEHLFLHLDICTYSREEEKTKKVKLHLLRMYVHTTLHACSHCCCGLLENACMFVGAGLCLLA